MRNNQNHCNCSIQNSLFEPDKLDDKGVSDKEKQALVNEIESDMAKTVKYVSMIKQRLYDVNLKVKTST